ncbi:tryptophan synthase subunit alpha [Halovenus rubra]|uniref:Tryptophan synthase alpha chain n=2 Tax=Halovenus rubra TaxID=869890 RepID=A0ABD5X7M9_9EURY
MSLEAVFSEESAFIPYLVAGDPTYEESMEYVEALARGGADIIELGLPFSEPIAEGPTIQQAIVRALDGGMTPDRYFEFVEELAVDPTLVCMTYYNLVYQYGESDGPESFVERAATVGIEGLVIPDLPAEEADQLRAACDEHGLDLVFIVAPTTTQERLERIREQVSGYIYVQARLGTTGARADLSDRTAETLARIEDWQVPKAVGFGIATGDHAQAVITAGADGIIVGSALVDIVADGDNKGINTTETASRIENKAQELKDGALAGTSQQPAPEKQ